MSSRGSCGLLTRQFKVPSWETPFQNSGVIACELRPEYGQQHRQEELKTICQNLRHMQLDAVLYWFLVHSSVANLARNHSRNLPWSLSERNCKTSLKLASMKTAASRRPGRRKHSSARFIIAVVVFFLAWHLVKNYPIVRIMFVSDRVSDNVALLVTILLVANSAANPLVYAFLKRDIKENSRGLSIGPWYQANC